MGIRSASKVCLLSLALSGLALSAVAQRVATVTIEAFPPETEIHVFLPGSPPGTGDVVPNAGPFQVKQAVSFPARLMAPGYSTKEVEVALVKGNASAPGQWRFHYELEPQGMTERLRHQFRRYPSQSYGGLLASLALLGASVFLLHRRLTREKRQAMKAQQSAEKEATIVREKLREVDPNLVGRTIDSYKVLALVGEGAYARVYRAQHVDYGDIFALKVLRPELLDARVQERMEREMAIGRDLVHPNLVRVFGYGVFREAPYLVLEFIEGTLLDEMLAEGSLSMPRAMPLLRQIATGVEFAHSRGVVHRDLKPANIFVTAVGEIKILDFGVAKILDSEARLTLTGQALGTPYYMSPEQARGRACPGSDVYALGVIAYEMLCGSPPFEGETALEVITAHAFSAVPSIREVHSGLSESMDTLLRQMMAKEPGERPQSMSEVLSRLAEIES